jgi:hypothetical protein
MLIRLDTLLDSIERSIINPINANLIREFYQFMKSNGTSASYPKNNLKIMPNFEVSNKS